MEPLIWPYICGRYWDRTSDLLGVSELHGSLFRIQAKEVQAYSRPIGRDVCAERPPVIGVKNTPGF